MLNIPQMDRLSYLLTMIERAARESREALAVTNYCHTQASTPRLALADSNGRQTTDPNQAQQALLEQLTMHSSHTMALVQFSGELLKHIQDLRASNTPHG